MGEGGGVVLQPCHALGSKASTYESAAFAFATSFAHLEESSESKLNFVHSTENVKRDEL